MYFQPYGDEQQLNLNWIISEIIELHKQLDPDYETPSFDQIYPYSNLNRLNLDWVLSELKTLKELAPEPAPAPALDIQAVAEALVALPFDSNTSYQIYDFISRDGEIWRATQAIAAGGDWDSTKWFKTKMGADLAVLERWINAIDKSLTSLQNTVENLSSADISDDSDAGGATVKASLNNLKGSIDDLNDITGDGALSGFAATDLTGAANELKGSLNTVEAAIANDVIYFNATDSTAVPCTVTTGNFGVKNDSRITADHIVAECVFAKPNAITTDVTWTTAAGSLTLNGACTSETTANVVLVKR